LARDSIAIDNRNDYFEATTSDGALQVYRCSDGTYFLHTRNNDARLSGVSVALDDLDALIAALYRLKANAR
jgi:hypothetical protein